MATPDTDVVRWGAFWTLMGVFGTILSGAYALLLKIIGAKANSDIVETNRKNIETLVGNLATKAEMHGHFVDDDHRFDTITSQLNRMEDNILTAIRDK